VILLGGVAVILIAAGVGGGIVMYGTVQRIDERTKALPDLACDVATLREDMATVTPQIDVDPEQRDEGVED
jgi:outer membrane murein-binding lipoprotein Lpp